MSATRGLRVAVLGATGALGGELLAVLDARSFPVGELVPLATDRSTGRSVEFQGEVYPVQTGPAALRDAELVFLCGPPGASLDLAHVAVREGAAAIDLSGALAGAREVPLLAAGVHAPASELARELVSALAGPALAWLRVLAPLAQAFGLRRVVGTSLEPVSGGGRAGIESLSAETVALFNQQPVEEPSIFGHPIAFDCVPGVGADDAGGAAAAEDAIAAALRRLLGPELGVAVTRVRMPTFVGDGAALAVETAEPASPEAAAEALRKAEDVALRDGPGALSTRSSAGGEAVLVGRLRSDPSRAGGLLLWLAADGLRLAAANAVRIAEARLDTR